MTRFIITSDWHLGLRLRYVAADRGARARNQRFETVLEIGLVAEERKVDAIVVAGDVFDDNDVSPEHVHQARDLLAKMPCPVVLIPGNHDYGCPKGALARLHESVAGLEHVHVLTGTEPLRVGETDFHPCPLLRRHTRQDPTAHLPVRNGEGTVRVAIAHGSIRDFSSDKEGPNVIDPDRVIEKGFDFLALGDWHSTHIHSKRAAYPGSHEPASMTELGAGHVLMVEIAQPGATPVVEPVRVGRIRLYDKTLSLESGADVEALEAELEAIDERSWAMVRLRLEGTLSLEEKVCLQELLERYAGQFLYLRADDERVETTLGEVEIAELYAPGFLGLALEELAQSEDPHAAGATQRLYRLLQQGA